MLLARDFVAHMASEVVKRLVEGEQIEVKAQDAVTTRIRQRMLEELTVEDRLNDEVRQILVERQDEMRSTGVSYQEMYKKVKQHLARDRKLVCGKARKSITGMGASGQAFLVVRAVSVDFPFRCNWVVHKGCFGGKGEP